MALPRLQRRAQPAAATSLDLLARLLAARGVDPSQGLKLQSGDLIPPISMRGLPEATARLADGMEAREHILVIGDYDADGATSTALLLLGLRSMGFAGADFLVPNRFEYGYGLTPEIVRVAAVREAAGIAAYKAGMFPEAISELRTARRMTGSNAFIPMIADCERGFHLLFGGIFR